MRSVAYVLAWIIGIAGCFAGFFFVIDSMITSQVMSLLIGVSAVLSGLLTSSLIGLMCSIDARLELMGKALAPSLPETPPAG